MIWAGKPPIVSSGRRVEPLFPAPKVLSSCARRAAGCVFMHRSTSRNQSGIPQYQDLFASFMMGLITFTSVGIVIYLLGVETPQAVGFSLLSGIAVTAFILRERSLMNRLAEMDRRHVQEIGRFSEGIEFFYQQSSIALVQYDAGTLMVERASVGFLDLLHYRAEDPVRGRRLEELLRVESTVLERFTDMVRQGILEAPQEIEGENDTGDRICLIVAGRYLAERHLIEASFQLCLRRNAPVHYDVDRALGDLERFRHGMARREHRILELKGEVNELLRDQGRPLRYKVDIDSEDNKSAVKSAVKSPAGASRKGGVKDG